MKIKGLSMSKLAGRAFPRLNILLFGILIVVAYGAYSIGYILADPNKGCIDSEIKSVWTSDRIYKATLIKKSCNMDGSIDYFVRLASENGKPYKGWRTFRQIQNDTYPRTEPTLEWGERRKLVVISHTKTLTGMVVEHEGYDVTIVRIFKALTPDSFPNFTDDPGN